MKTYTNLKQIKVGELFFAIRDETSDIKAIKEVVVNQSYKRKDFKPEAGETWIDIGANCGAFCVWAASLGAQVIAFEPDPGNYEICSANIGMNKMQSMIKLFDAGLTESDSAAVAILHRNTAKGNLWRNSLYKKWRGGESVKVKINPVHKYWNSNNCIKLDAEGVEMPILEKYADVRLKKLVFEWSFDIDPSITRFEKIIERLKAIYPNVKYAGYKSGCEKWQPEWFPACRTVWCY